MARSVTVNLPFAGVAKECDWVHLAPVTWVPMGLEAVSWLLQYMTGQIHLLMYCH